MSPLRDRRRRRSGDAPSLPRRDVPLEGQVHESALVTVCDECFETLEEPAATEPIATDELFHLVREATRLQGTTISAVADFASLATALPSTLESALETGTDAAVDDSVSEYRRTRRDILLAIAVVDARLERLAALDDEGYEPATRRALAAFSDTAADLQSTLREVVALSETVPIGLERCQGCFESLEASRVRPAGSRPARRRRGAKTTAPSRSRDCSRRSTTDSRVPPRRPKH